MEAGCRYVVCGGQDCEDWHDAVDMAFVLANADEPGGADAAPLVMTTWHEKESPDEVAFHFIHLTDFEDVAFRNYLVLHLGAGPEEQPLEATVISHALHRWQAGGGGI
ncbi:hypothetical protein OJ996_19170 [Luteolibacter sp. GHJ8]|uniref:DUF7684 domain-containing protein n=1 Tax=Luteolibacter rhizosphaerae TaxID=2989719 RepID=A0ABT3G786_9BACT|nr:hypothetical protein [Luteolibacter rhizosphaerae]MCW1915716.1 hypothetical protein [Luteolibacter rhizosphaerae]